MNKLKPNASFGATSSRGPDGEEKEPSISGKFKVTGVLAVGKEVSLALILKNTTSDRKTVTTNMTAWTIVYNGTLVHEVWKDSATISLDPEEEIQYPVKIAYSQYDRYLKADNMIRITAVCKVPDEAEVVVERDVILDNPTLTLEVLDQAQLRKPVVVQMLFSNPLDEPVKNCVLMVKAVACCVAASKSMCRPCAPRRSLGSGLRFSPLGLASSNCWPTFPAINSLQSRPCWSLRCPSDRPSGTPTELGNADQTVLSCGVKLLPMLSSLRSPPCPQGCQTWTSSKSPYPTPLTSS